MEAGENNMNFIDFSSLASVFSQTLDKDAINIGRKMTITDEEGWEIETDPKTPLYEGIPCHIEPMAMDNPDLSNDPTNPVITSYTVFAPPTTDVENGDYITLIIREVDGRELSIVRGIAGEPRQYTSRIEFSVGVQEWI